MTRWEGVEFWEGLVTRNWEGQSELHPRFYEDGDVRYAECPLCKLNVSTEQFYKLHAPEFCCMRLAAQLANERVNSSQMFRFLSLDKDGGWRKRKPGERSNLGGLELRAVMLKCKVGRQRAIKSKLSRTSIVPSR